MICTTCNKERNKGKVEKGNFTCSWCLAVAKKDKEKQAWIDKMVKLYQGIARAEHILHMVSYDLQELKNELSNHGITFTYINPFTHTFPVKDKK